MKLEGKKIAVLIESDFYEKEIFYYQLRFAEEGAELHFLSRLWDQDRLTFYGHEYKIPFECHESFENMSDAELRSYHAIIVPSGMVADRLRYVEELGRIPPAATFMKRAFAEPGIIKAVICHGMWLLAPIRDLIQGRSVVAHNNLFFDIKSYGLEFVNRDVVVDRDLITARSGAECNLLARTLIEVLAASPR